MFQRKTEILRELKKHMKKTFRRKVPIKRAQNQYKTQNIAAQKEADMKENNTTNTNNAGSMNIKVTVTPMKEREGCLKANASIILNDVFKVTGIRIGISQKGNIFVSMPDYKTGRLDDNGKDVYQDIAYPVTRQFRQELYDEIVKEFNTFMGEVGDQVGK